MKLVMTLLVRDEEDILEANINYHLNQNVDFIIATDNNSADATPDILQKYASMGLVHVIKETQDDYSQSVWVTRMARMAAEIYSADWVINNDADEFWWPKSGTLKDVFSAITDSVLFVRARRVNFPPINKNNILFSSDNPVFWKNMLIREVVSKNSLGNSLPPKVAHRGRTDVIVAQGNHSVIVNHNDLNEAYSGEPIVIFHYPIRSYSQFENKIKLGGAAYLRNTQLPKYVGNTWRESYKSYLLGELPEIYLNYIISDDDIKLGLSRGRYILERRLYSFLNSIIKNNGGDLSS